ncbi:hypothetical protein COU59_00580 [Candidatus Pacearchaeota archaeon CG10_big_fil_rev_8_21_14_0_10_34_12]|nr:MAG: hypothetical protein COU59_00580 [Candidatus Pacearchaeota archaeon CG10_big_fil_rev_8_21_14_0_10_34_12]
MDLSCGEGFKLQRDEVVLSEIYLDSIESGGVTLRVKSGNGTSIIPLPYNYKLAVGEVYIIPRANGRDTNSLEIDVFKETEGISIVPFH